MPFATDIDIDPLRQSHEMLTKKVTKLEEELEALQKAYLKLSGRLEALEKRPKTILF